jgi:hypothetical protein
VAKKTHKLELDGKPVESLYYYQHNWTANQTNLIHKGHCGDCKYGYAIRGKKKRGEQGVWVGPFDNLDLIKDYITKKLLHPKPDLHDCCKE